jgi:hypothetical protein
VCDAVTGKKNVAVAFFYVKFFSVYFQMKKSACTAFYVVTLVNIGAATKITGSEAIVCALYN